MREALRAYMIAHDLNDEQLSARIGCRSSLR